MAFRCKNMKGCSMYNYISSSVRIIQLQPFLNEYCLNPEKCKECARFKMKERGEKPPANLLPNGERIRF